MQICEDVRGLYIKKIIYNDLNPNNIYFKDYNHIQIKIGDFWGSKRLKDGACIN